MKGRLMTSYRWPVPASFFGMVLGIVGLGNCWRSASELWGWAYTFATAACALAGMRFLERGLRGPIEWLSPAIFVIANLVVGTIFLRTIWLLVRGRLFPATPPVPTPV